MIYIIYQASTTEPPGDGTAALIVFTCVAEALLVCYEIHSICKYDIKVSPLQKIQRTIIGTQP